MHAWVAAAKKEAGPDEFLRNSSDSASYFFVLFHLDTWMGLSGTRTIYYSNSTITNQFCLEIILCRVYSSFDYLIYPYYPAYTG